jgi:hypothetical protein
MASLLCSASPCSNIISITLSNEYSVFCTILWYITCPLQSTTQQQHMNSSDLFQIWRLNDCFMHLAVLPQSCHVFLMKPLWPYFYMSFSSFL